MLIRINSPNTAVVEIFGTIPTLAAKGEPFDLLIAPLPGTQTTSLAGGRLYTTELSALERFFGYGQYSKTVALGSGPVFINKLYLGCTLDVVMFLMNVVLFSKVIYLK